MELLLFGGFLSFIITGKPGERGVGKHSVNSDVGQSPCGFFVSAQPSEVYWHAVLPALIHFK